MQSRTARARTKGARWIAATDVVAATVCFVVGVLAISGGTARAQSAEAEALFNDGDKLMADGKTAEACDAFEASNRIESRAGTLIRLGECRVKNNQLASAWSAYKDALTRVKDPHKKDLATAALADIEPRLSYLTISVPDESRVDGLTITRNGKPIDPALWNRAVPVDGGDYTIGGQAPGHEEWSTKVTVPVDNGKISVEVPKFKELAKLVPPPGGSGPPPGGGSVTAHVDGGPGLFTTKREIALGVGGAGVVVGIVGIVEGLGAKSDQDQAYALCPDPATPCASAARATELTSSGHSKALIADISFGVGVAALAGAAYLWFTGGAEEAPRVSVVPRVAPDRAGLDVTVRF